MKLLKFVTFLIFIAILCSCSSAETKAEQIRIVEEKSYFQHFTIENNIVNIYCKIVIHNDTNSDIEVQLLGLFNDDKKHGLLCEAEILAEDVNHDRKQTFLVPPGDSTHEIVFTSENGTSSQKNNRLLPEIIILRTGDGVA